MQRDDNKTVREECTRELLIQLLSLNDIMYSDKNKLAKSAEFITNTPIQNIILYEVLIDKKTFAELGKTNNLTASRQKELLITGAQQVLRNFESFHSKVSFYKELEDKYIVLLKEKGDMELLIDKQKNIPPEIHQKLEVGIETVGFSNRLLQICEKGGVKTIKDLVKYSRKEFMSIRNCGTLSADEVEAYIKVNGLEWNMDIN